MKIRMRAPSDEVLRQQEEERERRDPGSHSSSDARIAG
jgi:hypothetical protein